ncbi:RING finger protein 145-like [Anneissia japonica]|uniref:RING finger protein 145-like n=1 Tax=Anneissia japonica TaxID=1529436 RepID=UPI001425614B|nr:RING finger protein 145-like [Anneissia japonica]
MLVKMKEQILSWLLRLPILFIYEFMYHKEIPQLLKENELVNNLGLDIDILTSCVQYGYLVAIVLFTLPIHHLKSLYIHLMIFILLRVSIRWSRDYITSSQDSDPQNIYNDDASVPRMIVYLMKQVVLVMTCILLMSKNRNWIFTAFIPTITVPTFGLEPNIAEKIHVVSCGFTTCVILSYLACSIPSLLDLAGRGLTELQRMNQQGDVASQLMVIYRKTYLPSMFVCLWICLFIFHNYISYKDSNLIFNTNIFNYVAMIADSFGSIWSLIGLCYVVSHTACFIYSCCKIYLVGFNGNVQNDDSISGTFEGMVIILLALQSEFLSYNRIDKIVNLSAFLFIVASNIIRNISDMTNPQLLLLSTRNNKKLAHFRVLVFVFILISIPIAMTYYFTQVIIVDARC